MLSDSIRSLGEVGSLDPMEPQFQEYYRHVLASRPDFKDIKEPFGIFYPRLDLYLSHAAQRNRMVMAELIERSFSGGLLAYLRTALETGYLGKGGATVPPHLFLLNFPASGCCLLWIPKNACTTLKTLLLSQEPGQRTMTIKRERFHESVQFQFGVKPIQFAGRRLLQPLCVVRNPFERLVSCYLDKFVQPAIGRAAHEEFIRALAPQFDDDLGAVTFRQFAGFVLRRPAWGLDAHWRPQSHFIGGLRKVIKFFGIDNVGGFAAWTGLSTRKTSANVSFGMGFSEATVGGSMLLADRPAREFSKLEIEDYGRLYDHDLFRRIAAFYAEDTVLFNEVTLDRVA